MGSLNVNELNFNLIKDNIKTYLSSQSEFTDYDFDGSGMNILMDLLSYCTHYMGIYGNMTFNEMFITTALLRASVVSKALELGYVPSQSSASVATINISVLSGYDVTIPKGTKFRGVNDLGNGYTFVNLSDVLLTTDSTTATGDVVMYEGTLVTDQWTYADNSGERYILGNENVDMKHLGINIKENSSTTDLVEWLSFSNIVNIAGDTEAYFYRETVESYVEIYFGNNVIGKSLINDNIILAESLVNNGSVPNGINVFTLTSATGIENTSSETFSVQNFTITTVDKSAEGANKESIDRIKHNAPLYYQTQNRSTTENDYTSILLKEFSYIQAISVWGGEENDPPFYGRVMISIKPESGPELSSSAETDILAHLDTVKVTGIIPVLVNPEYSYIDVTANVKYNAHLTSLQPSDIRSLVDTAIDNHFTNNLYAFDATLKYSELITDIDLADESIFSNYVIFKLRNDLVISETFKNADFTYTVSFNNPIKINSMKLEWTNSASESMMVKDDGEGTLYLYQDGELQTGTAGTINYTSGKLVLVNFNPQILVADTLNVYADPDAYDIETIQNNILLKGVVSVNVERVSV